jgi:hypothetical protein
MPQPDTADLKDLPEEHPQDYLVQQALYTLTPFFMDGVADDADKARAAAKEMLVAYKIGTALELQLAVECIIFSYSAMDTLRQAKVDPDMPVPQRVRLRNSATSLHRASHNTRRGLDLLQKARMTAEPQAATLHAEANAKIHDMLRNMTEGVRQTADLSAEDAAPPPFMNHAQRRAVELAARREARRAQG